MGVSRRTPFEQDDLNRMAWSDGLGWMTLLRAALGMEAVASEAKKRHLDEGVLRFHGGLNLAACKP